MLVFIINYMVLIQIDISKELSDKIKIYSIINNVSTKQEGIIKILGEKLK